MFPSPQQALKLATLLALTPCLLAPSLSALGLFPQGIGGGMVVEDEATQIKQRLGAFASMNATFRNEHGEQVTLADYCNSERPVILNLGYYRCPSLCGPVINGLVSALNAIDLDPGDFTVLSVSFDHREDPDIATEKKNSVIEAFPKPGAKDHWHFLTSDEKNVRKLTESVGYGFRWNTTRDDFDHRAVMIFLSPDGKITRYLRGAFYDPSSFRLAIVEASEGTVGSAMDRFILSCYSYDPLTGTYSQIGPMAMSIGGAVTLGGLAALLFVLWRRERRQVAPAAAS